MAAKEELESTGTFSAVLSSPVFRWLWIASIVSTVGTSMHDIAAVWLMTSLSRSPLYVSLVQTASTLPIFLLSIPSGALADIISRRNLLLLTQLWMFSAAALLAAMAFGHLVDPIVLLACSFLMGIGNALNIPPWQAMTADVLHSKNLQRGIILQSLGSNLARAVGPALGGMAVAAFGSAWVFLLNAVSFSGVILVLLFWRPAVRKSNLPTEHFLSAIRQCINFAVHSPELSTILVRTMSFMFFASAAMGLLPVVVSHHMAGGPQVLGLILAFNGLGAMAIAPFVRKLKKNLDLSCGLAAVAVSIALFGIALSRSLPVLCLCMLLAGAAWLVVNSTLNAATQVSSPEWIRARAISMQQLVFFGSLALGSAVWGALAAYVSTTISLCAAAVGMLTATLAVASSHRLAKAFALQLDYSHHWGEVHVDRQVPLKSGPALIKVEYVIDPKNVSEFRDAARQLRDARFRSGALRWEMYQDVSDSSRFMEIFLNESWVDHLRQHEHVPLEDKIAEERVLAYHIGPGPERMHFVYESLSKQANIQKQNNT